jgi:hypothetical protein
MVSSNRMIDFPPRGAGRRSVGAESWKSLVAGVLLTASIAPAAADALRGEMLRCTELTAPDARLACFDAVADALRPPRSLHDFGRDSMPTSRSADGEPGAEAMGAIIAAVRQRPRGEYVFELDNGQTWTESSPGRGQYQVGMPVRIERTPLGAYMLSTRGGRATRVRRLE